MPNISLVSLNIERSRHLDLVVPFLKKLNADVVTLQEVMQRDVPTFERELGAKSIYVGNTRHPAEGNPGVMGLGIFSKFPFSASGTEYYWGTDRVVNYDLSSALAKHETESHAVLYGDIQKDDAIFRVATTHFTWTPDGQPSDFQREDLSEMMRILQKLDTFILSGDFNAPRGTEIFEKIAASYKDNVPERYVWSLDTSMHYAGEKILKQHAAESGLRGFMVDGLFTTPEYQASDVQLHTGISDHKAISAIISKL